MKRGQKKSIIIYDDNCDLCNYGLHIIKQHNRQNSIEYLGINQGGQELANKVLADPSKIHDTVAFLHDGKHYTKSEAAIKIFSQMGGRWKLLSATIQIFPKKIRDKVYDLIAKNRHWIIPKKKNC